MMIAYICYCAALIGIILIAWSFGYASGQRHRAAINLSLIERDACERCKYLNRCLNIYHGDIAKASIDMEAYYCRQCAVYNTLHKGE